MNAVAKMAGYGRTLKRRWNETLVEAGAGSSGWTGFWGIAICIAGGILLLAERVSLEAGLSIQREKEEDNTVDIVIKHDEYQ